MRRGVVLSVLVALAAAGCSITSSPSNVDHMRCVKAHDQVHDNGVLTVCDLYEPEATHG